MLGESGLTGLLSCLCFVFLMLLCFLFVVLYVLIVFVVSFCILVIDFLSKSKIISIFKDGLVEKIFVNDFLDFILVFNTGISYGLFSGGGNLQKWVLIIL